VNHAAVLHDQLASVLITRHGSATGAASGDGKTSLTRWAFETTTIVLYLDANVVVDGQRRSQVSVVYVPTPRSDQREPDDAMLILFLLQMLGKPRR
jgi:hypothetical protein